MKDNPCPLEAVDTTPPGALFAYCMDEAKTFYWWLRSNWSRDHFGEPV
jgi:hypothetical protein